MDSNLLNRRVKYGARIFMHLWETTVFYAGIFYLHVARLPHAVPSNQILRICTKTRDMGSAFTGVETRLWPTVDHLDPPDLSRHGCNSDRGPAASGGQTVLANDRNGRRLRLNASRHDDDDDNDVVLILFTCFSVTFWNKLNIQCYYLCRLISPPLLDFSSHWSQQKSNRITVT